MTDQQPTSSIDRQQRRGAGWDVVDAAIQAYDEWMMDDDYDAIGFLAQLMAGMRARRALYDQDPSQDKS